MMRAYAWPRRSKTPRRKRNLFVTRDVTFGALDRDLLLQRGELYGKMGRWADALRDHSGTLDGVQAFGPLTCRNLAQLQLQLVKHLLDFGMLGAKPGPLLGRVLRQLEDAQLSGDATSREAALALARQLLESDR